MQFNGKTMSAIMDFTHYSLTEKDLQAISEYVLQSAKESGDFKGKDGTQIIPIKGDDLDLLVGEASNGELALVIGTWYLTTSDTNESGNAFVNAPAGTLFFVTGVDTVEEQVRIKGTDGKDYILTAADKAEITQSVLDALPIYGGETEEVAANE